VGKTDEKLSGDAIHRNTLSDILRRTRARFPNKRALIYGRETLTYKELDELVNCASRLLLSDGVKKGQLYAVLTRNNMDFVIVNFALARIGAVMVPINYMLTVPEIEYIIHHANVDGFFASPEFYSQLDEASKRCNLRVSLRYLLDVTEEVTTNTCQDSSTDTGKDSLGSEQTFTWRVLRHELQGMSSDPVDIAIDAGDLAQVLYTSGTESRPKGVMLSHENLLAEYMSCIIDGQMESHDVFIHALPLYHSAQLHCFLGPSVYLGATGVILSNAAPKLLLETIETYHATQLFCPPTVWIGLLRHPLFDEKDLSSLCKCYYGAAIMPREILKELSNRLPKAKFWNFYGQTEVAPLATTLKPEDQLRKLGSAGKPAIHVETKIVDDEGNEVLPGEVGEIVHRTPHAMLGYLNDPEKTAEAFQNGWFHSGDLGFVDEEGYLTVVDRKKDMIKTGGINVSSREVEEVIYQHPSISEVAVVGVPDDYWIESVTAVVVCKEGQTLDINELIEFCRPNLSKFKIPKHIVFRDELPKNPSGKILKRELRNAYADLGRSS
jgi:fatty-acyl-CoA synthase